MSFIKKYSILLIPAGIVVPAVVFVAGTVLMNRSLAGDIQKSSVASAGQINRLLPNAKSAKQWQEEKNRQDAHEQDINAVVQLAQQCTVRELISYRIFPKPTDRSQQVFDEYAAMYREAIEQMIRGMNAMEAPSEMEISSEIGDSAGAGGTSNVSLYSTAPRSSSVRTTSSARSGGMDAARQAMIDAVCAKRAEQIAVYANPTVFGWYEYWGDFKFPGEDPALMDCWNSQVAYWIYEDVAATINALNAGSTSVYASPVKRLLGVSFTQDVGYPQARNLGAGYGAARSSGRGAYDEGYGLMRGDAPEYIRLPSGGLALGVEPWTARLCNEEIDVVHFSVGAITASSAVMPFMKELCSVKEHKWWPGFRGKDNETPPQTGQHNQITILKSEVIPVERTAAENASYRYGDEAVVRLNLVCEYIFNRAAYDMIKPDKIKEHLSPQTGDPTQTEAGGAPRLPAARTAPAPAAGKSSSRKPARDIGGDLD